MNPSNIYPRTGDTQTVYLNQVVTDPSILVGDYTMYNDFVNDPIDFEKNNVLYHYPVNHDRLVIVPLQQRQPQPAIPLYLSLSHLL